MTEMGYGSGYKYPHNFEGHYVPEEYLPEALLGTPLYTPSTSGAEPHLASRLKKKT
jgi:putative ATPase